MYITKTTACVQAPYPARAVEASRRHTAAMTQAALTASGAFAELTRRADLDDRGQPIDAGLERPGTANDEEGILDRLFPDTAAAPAAVPPSPLRVVQYPYCSPISLAQIAAQPEQPDCGAYFAREATIEPPDPAGPAPLSLRLPGYDVPGPPSAKAPAAAPMLGIAALLALALMGGDSR